MDSDRKRFRDVAGQVTIFAASVVAGWAAVFMPVVIIPSYFGVVGSVVALGVALALANGTPYPTLVRCGLLIGAVPSGLMLALIVTMPSV